MTLPPISEKGQASVQPSSTAGVWVAAVLRQTLLLPLLWPKAQFIACSAPPPLSL